MAQKSLCQSLPVPRTNCFLTPVVIQLDQSVARAPFAIGQCPCIIPKGKYWHSTRRRLLTHVELAYLQGMSAAELELVGSTTLLKNMVGNSFTAPVIGALLLGVCAALGASQR